jgi:hypothetical protein
MARQLPSQTHDNFWVSANDKNLTAQFPNQDGKWMMFFPLSEMDARWTEASQLYYSGRLTGVNSMKASTAKQNPMPERLHGPDEGIIIFYCGPSEDEANVMEYGRNILNNMHYPRETFYYKSDKPHLIDWSKQYRHMYSINTIQHYGGGFGGIASIQNASFGSNYLAAPVVESSFALNLPVYGSDYVASYVNDPLYADYYY